MSLITVETLSTSDTATFLRIKLGQRGWRDFLGDCIRYRQDIFGFVLLPCMKMKTAHGFENRYSMADIRNFVDSVQMADPTLVTKKPLETMTICLDTHKPWRMRKYDQYGAPIPIPISISTI